MFYLAGSSERSPEELSCLAMSPWRIMSLLQADPASGSGQGCAFDREGGGPLRTHRGRWGISTRERGVQLPQALMATLVTPPATYWAPLCCWQALRDLWTSAAGGESGQMSKAQRWWAWLYGLAALLDWSRERATAEWDGHRGCRRTPGLQAKPRTRCTASGLASTATSTRE